MLVKGKRCQPLIEHEGLLECTWSAGERQSGRDDKEGEEGNVRHLQEGDISPSQNKLPLPITHRAYYQRPSISYQSCGPRRTTVRYPCACE